MAKCPVCQAENAAESTVCIECGAKMEGGSLTGQLPTNSILEDRYVILKTLGQGGMGAVYLAQDQRLNNHLVAVKEMSTNAVGRNDLPAAVEAFKREAALLIQLRHPALPRIMDFFSDDEKRWYLVMDYIEGETLQQIADRRGPIPESEVVDWAKQLGEVLSFLHEQDPPIIYRDLKPSNIMLTPDGRIKLIDFGIARHFRFESQEDTNAFGSSGYAAPEQYGTAQTDARTDVYGLGATLHYLITGRDPSSTPFKFDSPSKPISISPQLETAIMKCLEISVEKRPQSIREVMDLLPGGDSSETTLPLDSDDGDTEELVDVAVSPQKPTNITTNTFSRKRSKVKTVGLAVAVVLCLLAGAAFGYGYLKDGSTNVIANMDSKLELAIKYLSEDQYEKAIIAYQEIIKIDPKNVEAYQGLSLAFILNNQSGRAEEALQQGLQELPGNAKLQLILAGLWSDQGKNEEAEALYKEIIASQSGVIPVYEAYYHWLASMGKVDEAITLLEDANLQNKSYLIFNWLAALYHEMGMADKSLAAIRQSLLLQPNQWKAYELIEKHYNFTWNDISALADQYIEQGQTEIGMILKLRALLGQGAYQELIQQYQQSGQETKDNYQAKYLLAQAYLQLGQKENALEALAAIPIDKLEDAALISKLAECYLDMGELVKARTLALRGIALDDTLIDNYLIMFRSYSGNEAESRVWALRYLMNSGLGYTSHRGFYQGEFTGQYSGAESGTFTAVIDQNKNVKVTGQSPMLGVITGSGQLSESGNLSFNASGSVSAGIGLVFTVSFNGEMRVENGSINASGTWYSVDFPQITGNWAITPVPWESSVNQVLASFKQSNAGS